MLVRKWTKDKELEVNESVKTAVRNVGIRDGLGNKNKLVAGVKYIVSGDVPTGLFEEEKKPTVAKKEVSDG